MCHSAAPLMISLLPDVGLEDIVAIFRRKEARMRRGLDALFDEEDYAVRRRDSSSATTSQSLRVRSLPYL
jgi:hypothetical protein